MIPDLKNKASFLLTLVPTVFWTTFMADLNPVICLLVFVGAILSGMHLAIVESVEKIPFNENHQERFKNFRANKYVRIFFNIVWFYAIVSYIGFIYILVTRLNNLAYYQWLAIVIMIILAVSFGVGMKISPEKREGFRYAANYPNEPED